MAAAIILIPEMLSGPERVPEQETARASTESNVKTYTIDLADPPTGQSQSSSQRATQISGEGARLEPPRAQSATEAASPSAVIPEGSPQAMPELAPPPEDEAAIRSPAARATEPPARQSSSEPARSEPTAAPPARARNEESRPPALASSSSVPTTKGWAVQLGSFSSAASAQRLSNEFRSDGFDAFVMPVKTGSTTLYRVRLGPVKDRAAAETVLKRARAKVTGAAIVAHP
jgi:DedD protein